MTTTNGFVLVHGAWHNHRTWDAVVPQLEAAGHVVRAIDLPGAGANASHPASYAQRPLDPAAFGTEPSPNAGVTQDERTEATVAAIREVNARSGGRAVLVGHSLGGLTASAVAEAVPDELSAVVYLTAFLLPAGMVAGQIITHELMAEAMVPGLFMADPEQVGALRLDPKSEDADYVARVRQAFYADLTDVQFDEALRHLHPDEPAQVAGVASPVSADRFGSVRRHYIECTQDRAILIDAQREMVRLVDQEMGNTTNVHTLEASHSPFHSQPEALSDILKGIAVR